MSANRVLPRSICFSEPRDSHGPASISWNFASYHASLWYVIKFRSFVSTSWLIPVRFALGSVIRVHWFIDSDRGIEDIGWNFIENYFSFSGRTRLSNYQRLRNYLWISFRRALRRLCSLHLVYFRLGPS